MHPPTHQAPLDHKRLCALLDQGEDFKYLFFWGHTPSDDGHINASCLSQWYDASFELDGIEYDTAEHYMMAEKAKLFGDQEIRETILAAPHPGAAKKLGRQVRRFDQELWDEHRFAIVTKGNLAKFSQDKDLKDYLLGTGTRILVEASPRDKIWGIGMDKRDPRASQPHRWQGKNLLGFALMAVREQLVEGTT